MVKYLKIIFFLLVFLNLYSINAKSQVRIKIPDGGEDFVLDTLSDPKNPRIISSCFYGKDKNGNRCMYYTAFNVNQVGTEKFELCTLKVNWDTENTKLCENNVKLLGIKIEKEAENTFIYSNGAKCEKCCKLDLRKNELILKFVLKRDSMLLVKVFDDSLKKLTFTNNLLPVDSGIFVSNFFKKGAFYFLSYKTKKLNKIKNALGANSFVKYKNKLYMTASMQKGIYSLDGSQKLIRYKNIPVKNSDNLFLSGNTFYTSGAKYSLAIYMPITQSYIYELSIKESGAPVLLRKIHVPKSLKLGWVSGCLKYNGYYYLSQVKRGEIIRLSECDLKFDDKHSRYVDDSGKIVEFELWHVKQ